MCFFNGEVGFLRTLTHVLEDICLGGLHYFGYFGLLCFS